MSSKKTIIVKTRAFKKTVLTAFKILEDGKVLDSKTFADVMQCSLGTANKWLARLSNEGVLIRTQVNDTAWGGRKYVYCGNENVKIGYSYGLFIKQTYGRT